MLTTLKAEIRLDSYTYFILFILERLKNKLSHNLTQNFLATVTDSKMDL